MQPTASPQCWPLARRERRRVVARRRLRRERVGRRDDPRVGRGDGASPRARAPRPRILRAHSQHPPPTACRRARKRAGRSSGTRTLSSALPSARAQTRLRRGPLTSLCGAWYECAHRGRARHAEVSLRSHARETPAKRVRAQLSLTFALTSARQALGPPLGEDDACNSGAFGARASCARAQPSSLTRLSRNAPRRALRRSLPLHFLATAPCSRRRRLTVRVPARQVASAGDAALYNTPPCASLDAHSAPHDGHSCASHATGLIRLWDIAAGGQCLKTIQEAGVRGLLARTLSRMFPPRRVSRPHARL